MAAVVPMKGAHELARGGSQTRDSREADAWARETPRLCKAGRGRSGAAPGHQHHPGGCGIPTRTPPSLRLSPRGTLRNTDTQPVPRGERRQPPPCPGEGKLRHGTIIATARDTERLRDKFPGDGAALAPSGVSPRPPERPESSRTGQIRATRSPDPGSSLRPGPLRWGGATPVPRAGLLSARAAGPRSAPSSPAVRPTAGPPSGSGWGSGSGSGSGSRCRSGSLRSATSTGAGSAPGKFPA